MNTTKLVATSLALASISVIAACQQQSAEPQSTWSDPLPDLNTVEECQRADLGRYWGSTFRFHRDGCWANVTFDERGNVTTFEPDEAAICKQVLARCG